MKNYFFLFGSVCLLSISLSGCGSNYDPSETEDQTEEKMYFPPNSSDVWETRDLSSLGWKTAGVQPLYDYLELKHSRSFIILYNGKIVLEKYFGTHTATTPWYWASAGKTLTSATTGIAQQNGLLNIEDQVSKHLGTGWTSETPAKENLIKIKHLLTMTSGLNDAFGDNVSPQNLQYIADAGTRWAYHNVYVKLQDVVAAASGKSFENYFNANLRDVIGMSGQWIDQDDLSVYYSNTRSMARFGLLALNAGNWNGTQVISKDYMTAATQTSQNINLSYGYLWWLNGKASYHLPSTQIQFTGSLIQNAPSDMFCALGKNDQKIYVVPSKKLVIIRMGDAADASNFALSGFDNDLWAKINNVIN